MKKNDSKKYLKFLNNTSNNFNIIDAIYIFIFCGFLGFVVEILYVYLSLGKIVKRGMTYGPICTIYGLAALLLYFVFKTPKKNKINVLITFVLSTILLGSFELLSGLFLKYLFNIEMWNYSGKFLEIYNYTTIPIAIGWGIFSCIYIYSILPILLNIFHKIKEKFEKSYDKLAYILLFTYFLDYTFSFFNIMNNPQILEKLVNP